MDAKELEDLVKKYKENRDFITNEETAKMALVVPFIRLLGYDTQSPREVRLEFCAPFAQGDGKKLSDRMDFAIFDRSGLKPLMVIETKPLGTDLKANSKQLARYIAQMPELHFGIITDGCHYLFFGDLESPNVMDTDPFFTFSLEDPKTDWGKVAKFLSKFSREAFNAETLVTDAENARYKQAIIERLIAALKDPNTDPDFLSWLTTDIIKGKRTAKVQARLNELAADAIEPAILRVVGDGLLSTLRERIEQARETPNVVQKVLAEPMSPAASGKAPAAVEPKPVSVAVETSAEELSFFELVKSTLAGEGVGAEDLLWKDTTNYFNISYKKPTKWFVRLFTGKRWNIVTPLPVADVQAMLPSHEIEESPAAFGTSRIYIDSIQQVSTMKPLLVRCLQTLKNS